MKSVVFAGLPMEPDPHAVYEPRHFLPNGEIDAINGQAKLPDGSTIAIDDLSAGKNRIGSRWDREGNPVKHGMPRASGIDSDFGVSKNPTDRLVQLWIDQQTSSNDGSQGQQAYDGEGWPFLQNFTTEFYPKHLYRGFFGSIGASFRKTDLTCPIAIGPFKLIARFERNNPVGTTWSYDTSAPTNPGLRVEYPVEISDKFAGKDWRILPLDANGKEVIRADGGGLSQSTSGWVKFDFSKAEAARVAAVEIRARPYVWVRFPDVALAPNN
jgi:hypothetical protein